MEKDEATDNHKEKSEHHPYRVRLPGFVADEDIGLGDVIKRVTSTFGIKPCGGCNTVRLSSTAGLFSRAGIRSRGSSRRYLIEATVYPLV